MDPEFSRLVEAAAEIRTSGRWERLNDRIRALAANPGRGNGWYVKVFGSLLFHTCSEYLELKAIFEHAKSDDAALLAWRARSLLELSIWSTYCAKSRDNARRFYEDAGRDALNVVEAFTKWGVATRQPQDWLNIQKVAATKLQKRALGDGIESLDGPYKQVSDAAKECGLGPHFTISYKLLSKFAHPTALRIIGSTRDEANELPRDIFFAKGCMYFGGSFEALEQHLKQDVQTETAAPIS